MLDLRRGWGGFEQPQDLWQLSQPGGGLYTLKYWHGAVGSFEGDDRCDDDSSTSDAARPGPRPGDGLLDGTLIDGPFDARPEM